MSHGLRYHLALNKKNASILDQAEIEGIQRRYSDAIKEQMKTYSSVDQESLLKVKINQQSTNSIE